MGKLKTVIERYCGCREERESSEAFPYPIVDTCVSERQRES